MLEMFRTLQYIVYWQNNFTGYESIVQSVLSDISDVISTYPGYTLVFGGDLNNDMTISSKVSKILKQFMTDFKLILCNDVIKPNCDYTYIHESQQHLSYVDYFLISDDIVGDVIEFQILDDMVNMSDHLPIFMSLRLSLNTVNIDNVKVTDEDSNNTSTLRWDHADL